jgi:hypothetical protein
MLQRAGRLVVLSDEVTPKLGAAAQRITGGVLVTERRKHADDRGDRLRQILEALIADDPEPKRRNVPYVVEVLQ